MVTPELFLIVSLFSGFEIIIMLDNTHFIWKQILHTWLNCVQQMLFYQDHMN